MMSGVLYKREMKASVRLLVIFGAVLTLYVSIIISMYDPELSALLDSYVELMPELMAAVGMTAGSTTLIGFMCSYLYGFILLIFPMLFCILRGNALVAKYVEDHSMVSLVAAPVKRRTIALTQMLVLLTGTVILVGYSTILELVCGAWYFPGELDTAQLLTLNGGLLCLHLLIGGICFAASCLAPDTKYSVGFGAGVPILMYVIQMLANMGGKVENAKYFTFFTLFDPEGLVARESGALAGAALLGLGGLALYGLGAAAFCRKDLHI